MAVLLKEHGKFEQEEAVIRGELAELNLSLCTIGKREAGIIEHFLKTNETVVKASFNGCRMGWEEIRIISGALKVNTSVKILDMEENLIDKWGGRYLIEALTRNVCIVARNVRNESIIMPGRVVATIDYLTKTRNQTLIPCAVRRAALFLIHIRRGSDQSEMGPFALLPIEIVRIIAVKMWASRKDVQWIRALPKQPH